MGWPRRALGLALAALLQGLMAGPVLAVQVARTQVGVSLPPGRSVLSAYVNGEDGALVLHVQPTQSAVAEQLIDARTGKPWSGDLSLLLKNFSHLGSEAMADVASGQAPDLALLRALGCTRGHVMCTSAQDADVLLLVGPVGRDGATLTVIDLRAVLAEMDEVLAGRKDGNTVNWGELEWQVLAVAAQLPERRARWVDALRSIRSIDGFQRVLASVTTAPRLGAQPMFQGTRPAVDLRAELEVLGHRLLVGGQAAAVLAGGGAQAAGQLADALESATQPPNQIGVATHLVDLLAGRPDAERQQLAGVIRAEATRRHSEVLHCFSQWLSQQPCGEGAPPWVVREAPAAVVATAPQAPTRPAERPRRTPANPPATPSSEAATPGPTPTPTTPAAPAPPAAERVAEAAGAGSDAPHEWTQIQGVPNKLVLVSFAESSGRMVVDQAVVGGTNFVARALGPVADGRFEVQVSSSSDAPVRLRYGQYRVRARLVLDYTREDQCVRGMSCWFTSPELHAKSVPREVVFFMTVSSRFVDRRRCNFGTLLPLVADGNARYRSQLKEARLAIESVRFELL
jgi:hypothetical protein